MLEFFKTYNINDIIVYTILLIFAIKGIIETFSWFKGKYDSKFNKDYTAKRSEEKLVEFYEKCDEQYQTLENKLDRLTDQMSSKVEKIDKQLNQLTQSDMHDIKGWIVEKHHELMKRGWVDDFTMDTLERRYMDYVAEDGNSYVAKLMAELRDLPHYDIDED